MDNAVDALIMAFSVFVFIIALSISMVVFAQATTTSEILTYFSDKTNYYDNIEITEGVTDKQKLTTRIVGAETIIPTLYRYYKENFCVKIYDDSDPPKLLQLFDINIEGKVRKAAGYQGPKEPGNPTDEEKQLEALKGSRYNNNRSNAEYLFEAQWIGNTDIDTKARIDFFVNGKKGYINDTLVDYEVNKAFCDAVRDNRRFIEEFVEYVFSGDTITVGEGDGTETITGNAQENSKIVITYTMLP